MSQTLDCYQIFKSCCYFRLNRETIILHIKFRLIIRLLFTAIKIKPVLYSTKVTQEVISHNYQWIEVWKTRKVN